MKFGQCKQCGNREKGYVIYQCKNCKKVVGCHLQGIIFSSGCLNNEKCSHCRYTGTNWSYYHTSAGKIK